MGCGASSSVAPVDSISDPYPKNGSKSRPVRLQPTAVGYDARRGSRNQVQHHISAEGENGCRDSNSQLNREVQLDLTVGNLLASVVAQAEAEVQNGAGGGGGKGLDDVDAIKGVVVVGDSRRMSEGRKMSAAIANSNIRRMSEGRKMSTGVANPNSRRMSEGRKMSATIANPASVEKDNGDDTADGWTWIQGSEPETKRVKKEKRAKELQKKTKKKDSKSSLHSSSGLALEDVETAPENPSIPLFVFKCVQYIESEGMQTEGIYRISGNKAQGELFLSKFSADHNVDIASLEIPVNAIATLLKSFFSDLNEALIPSSLCDELMEAAARGEKSEMGDKSGRLLMLRGVIKKLPTQNYELLKFIISHLFRVAVNQEVNSMGSGNLAKCWWPTLIRLQFKSYEKMVQGTQIPEDIIHTLIEQSNFFFYGGDEV